MDRPNRSSMRWTIVAMAFLGTTINYIDRANLGVALPALKKEFGLSPEMSGLILGAFFWTYASFQLPSGWFVDKVGPRISYTVAVVWWSIFTSATAIARGFGSMFGFRLLLGIGEAPAYPTNAKSVAEWFPKSERAFATAIYDSGARAGTVDHQGVGVALLVRHHGHHRRRVVVRVVRALPPPLAALDGVGRRARAHRGRPAARDGQGPEGAVGQPVQVPHDLGDDARVLLPELRHLLLRDMVPDLPARRPRFHGRQDGHLGHDPGPVRDRRRLDGRPDL
jgi:hypothetical protein